MSLGSYIKERREERHMSQRDLATACALSNAEISRIETGLRKQPSPKVIKQIADALHVPVSDLLVEAGILEKGTDVIMEYSNDNDTPLVISPDFHVSEQYKDIPYITVDDLTEEEIEDVKKYILFIKSKRSL